LEVKKVQLIREDVASLESKKLDLDKVEEYWRALQAAADMEGVTNAAYHSGRDRGNGNRGGRGGNRGGRGGRNSGNNNDNTQSNEDNNAVDNDNAGSSKKKKKKKKKGLRKQPADHMITQEKCAMAHRETITTCASSAASGRTLPKSAHTLVTIS
jgi:hypothetical protein